MIIVLDYLIIVIFQDKLLFNYHVLKKIIISL